MNEKYDILFILGSGASVDSGLPTYRGPNGIYKNNYDPESYFRHSYSIEKIWNFFNPLLESTFKAKIGPTYEMIKEIIKEYPNSVIFNQNIDGLATKCIEDIPIIELHGNNRWMKCTNKKCGKIFEININKPYCSCGEWCRPDIVVYGENLDQKNFMECCKLSKKFYKYVIIIGTTLQFPYLNKLKNNVKCRYAKVIHINPDDNYDIIKKNEIWIKDTSYNGLKQFLDKNII